MNHMFIFMSIIHSNVLGVLQKINVLLQCIFVKKDALAFKCERGHGFILTGKVITHRCPTCIFMPVIFVKQMKNIANTKERAVVSLCSRLERETEYN